MALKFTMPGNYSVVFMNPDDGTQAMATSGAYNGQYAGVDVVSDQNEFAVNSIRTVAATLYEYQWPAGTDPTRRTEVRAYPVGSIDFDVDPVTSGVLTPEPVTQQLVERIAQQSIAVVKLTGVTGVTGETEITLTPETGAEVIHSRIGRFAFRRDDGFFVTLQFEFPTVDRENVATLHFEWPTATFADYSITLDGDRTSLTDVVAGTDFAFANWTKTGGTQDPQWTGVEFKTLAQLIRDYVGNSGAGGAPSADEIADVLDARHGGGSWQTTAVVGATPVPLPIPIPNAQLVARAGHTFTPSPFVLQGDDSSGWTSFVFIVKQSAASDDDDDALLVIRVTNPAAGDDGLIRKSGRDAASAALASIGVSVSSGDTIISLNISALGMDIAPSEPENPYPFELVRWRGEIKEPIAEGTFAATRSAHRGAYAP